MFTAGSRVGGELVIDLQLPAGLDKRERRTYVRTMKSIWLQCSDCAAARFEQFEGGDRTDRFCGRCGTRMGEVAVMDARGPAGGGPVGHGSHDPEREAIEMVRQAFGPDVTEIDSQGRPVAARELQPA